ncbi:hypothetical protein ACFYU5_26125 [Nocardia aobensis]|uniref:Uncharacterized protein n=1 Tax=Nocardia aobensis TaxID=257277 RepID=A0ABW6P9U5_9NOCA
MNSAVTSRMEIGAQVADGYRQPGIRRIEQLLEASPTGWLTMSLTEIAVAAGLPTVGAARMALRSLDPIDHTISVDVDAVDPQTTFDIVWAPVLGIVDLMLDWGLSTVEVSVDELAAWLTVGIAVTHRALRSLAVVPGIHVEVSPIIPESVRISLDVTNCPLTTPGCSAA